MSVLLPWVLAFGGVMVAGIVALHLLARNEPPRWLLPNTLEIRLRDGELTVNGFPARGAVGLWKRPRSG